MEVRRNLLVGYGGLMVFFILLAFAALSLQERVYTTIQTMERVHFRSIEGALGLLGVTVEDPLATERSATYAYGKIHTIASHATSPQEAELARQLTETLWCSDTGSAATFRAVGAQEIVRMNVTEMRAHAQTVHRHAQGGIWILLFLGTVGVWGTWYFWRRFRQRIQLPVASIAHMMSSATAGLTPIRVHLDDAPQEIKETARYLNTILDERDERAQLHYTPRTYRMRVLSSGLLSRLPLAAFLIENQEVVGTNQEGMLLLQGEMGRRLRAAFQQENWANAGTKNVAISPTMMASIRCITTPSTDFSVLTVETSSTSGGEKMDADDQESAGALRPASGSGIEGGPVGS